MTERLSDWIKAHREALKQQGYDAATARQQRLVASLLATGQER